MESISDKNIRLPKRCAGETDKTLTQFTLTTQVMCKNKSLLDPKEIHYKN